MRFTPRLVYILVVCVVAAMPGPTLMLSLIMAWSVLGRRWMVMAIAVGTVANIPVFLSASLGTWSVASTLVNNLLATVNQVQQAVNACGLANSTCISNAVAPVGHNFSLFTPQVIEVLGLFDIVNIALLVVVLVFVWKNVRAIRRRLALRKSGSWFMRSSS